MIASLLISLFGKLPSFIVIKLFEKAKPRQSTELDTNDDRLKLTKAADIYLTKDTVLEIMCVCHCVRVDNVLVEYNSKKRKSCILLHFLNDMFTDIFAEKDYFYTKEKSLCLSKNSNAKLITR